MPCSDNQDTERHAGNSYPKEANSLQREMYSHPVTGRENFTTKEQANTLLSTFYAEHIHSFILAGYLKLTNSGKIEDLPSLIFLQFTIFEYNWSNCTR